MLLKRSFDVICSALGLLILFPIFMVIALCIIIESRGGAFYLQRRVGKNNKDFTLYKFRTMAVNSDKELQLTVGVNDRRITQVGSFLRKFKLDELPQLLNVLLGEMSLVGPRPEVRKYVDLYTPDQARVLNVKPGITDMASIKFINENEILGRQSEPEKYYIETIMPLKLEYNLEYLNSRSFVKDIKVIFSTLFNLGSRS